MFLNFINNRIKVLVKIQSKVLLMIISESILEVDHMEGAIYCEMFEGTEIIWAFTLEGLLRIQTK